MFEMHQGSKSVNLFNHKIIRQVSLKLRTPLLTVRTGDSEEECVVILYCESNKLTFIYRNNFHSNKLKEITKSITSVSYSISMVKYV